MNIRLFCDKYHLNYRDVIRKMKNRDKYHINGVLHMTNNGVKLIEKTYKIKPPSKKRKNRATVDSKETNTMLLDSAQTSRLDLFT